MKYIRLIITSFVVCIFSSCQDVFDMHEGDEEILESALYRPYDPPAYIKEYFSRIFDSSESKTGEYYKFLEVASFMYEDQLGHELLEFLIENGVIITFKIDPYLSGMAMFDTSNWTITFRDIASITQESVEEEILHAVQLVLCGASTMSRSSKNIEFEVKVFRDLWEAVKMNCIPSSYFGISGLEREGYEDEYKIFIACLYNWGWGDFFNDKFKELSEEWKGETLQYNKYFSPYLISTFWPLKESEI
ncbi:hypothetical protein [Butyricimonas synergistica]|uniref:hypothetical protein n=1 Tax=Butyricimonas synergistica TaxID=544644 RepID=UPI0012DF7E61|nr:hypothetical protein [Butyricimonas synergistica]